MPRQFTPPFPLLLVLLFAVQPAFFPAIGQVTSITQRVAKPDATTLLTVIGKDLDDSLRVISSSSLATVRVQSVEPTRAVVELTLPAGHPLGPLGLWFATSAGPAQPHVVIVDGLDPVQDNGNNHSIATAQSIPSLSAIVGHCEAAKSDYYRISVTEGQRVAFEIQTQSLRSAMDPVLRILDGEGKSLHLVDDGPTGPDFRFTYKFESAGDYVLQIHDNRFTASGAYCLRVGDFPNVSHAFPLAVQKGQKTAIDFVTSDGSEAESISIQIPLDASAKSVHVSAHSVEAKSLSWATLMLSDFDQVLESDLRSAGPENGLDIPVGISGHLGESGERDSYSIRGIKGQTVRVAAHAQSIGCPTLLQMQLFDPANNKVGETKVSEADEWSFDYAFPEDGVYKLQVSDLLSRGGIGFAYWVELKAAGSFSVALKSDKATKERFAIQTENGACAIDLQIDRFGYDGAIDLAFDRPTDGIKILNPRIPTKSKARRIYLQSDAGWTSATLESIRLRATATDAVNVSSLVSSTALHRLTEPFVLVPPAWSDGAITLAGVAKTDSPVSIVPTKPLQMARPLKQHATLFTLQRKNQKFKTGVTVLPASGPDGWRASGKLDKDALTVTFAQSNQAEPEPEQLAVSVFADFGGRGRIETFQFPIEWIDPVQLELNFLAPLIVGRESTVRAAILRQGNDPQSVILKPVDLPAGVTAPESVTIPADQPHVDFPISLAADARQDVDRPFRVDAQSKYNGVDFSISSDPIQINIVELPTKLSIFPSEMDLDGPLARQQLVVTGYDANDSPRDWTRDVHIAIANTDIAELRDGVVHAKSDGQTELVCEVGGVREIIPLRVSNVQAKKPTAFESEVLVALSKQGCNSGACHGSPSGKGNFRLSLRAFDRELDELTLIREEFGRRVNVLEPHRSLLLQKPTMQVAHGGGKRLRKTDDAYRILQRWIAEGAKVDPEGTARCDQLKVFPRQKRLLSVSAGGQQLAINARFADGSSRDVTNLIAYSSSNTSVATVDENGFVTPHQQGETVILARYLEHIESLPLMFVERDAEFQWQPQPANNYVDELVDAKLRQLQHQPSPLCNDSEFLRRVHLDVIGVLPSIEETQQFLSSSEPEKRSHLIDDLLQREEYAKFWTLKWGDLLRMTGAAVGDAGVFKYHRWVEESIRDNMPYDQFATALVTATGSTLANPPANFYRTATDMNECVETISQVFLGARLQCAKCHNHPFERWTQDNYYGLGAFFHRVQRRKTPRPGEMFVYVSDSGDVTQPRTGQTMQPWLPNEGEITAQDDQDRRTNFARWLTKPDNPYFARIEANRIWSQFFSRGIVDPIDDFRDSNPPSNVSLLDALTKDFVESGYDRKHVMRTILNSRTYQASYQTNDSNQTDDTYFSHQEPRMLGAEQLLDAINHTLNLSDTFGNLPAGTNATQLPSPDIAKVDFLKTFGQPERRTVCACERSGSSNLGMAIELFNGTEIHRKLKDQNNRFHKALVSGKSPEETIHELYLAAICRPPSEQELKASMEHCATRDNIAAGVEDVCWALFNTDEFVFQH